MLSNPGYFAESVLDGVLNAQPFPFTTVIQITLCKFIYVQSVITTDATPGLRAPFLEVKDNSGNSLMQIGTGVQNPNTTLRYLWSTGSGFLTGFGIIFPKYLPLGFILKKDWTISIDSFVKGPGDVQDITFQMGPVM